MENFKSWVLLGIKHIQKQSQRTMYIQKKTSKHPSREHVCEYLSHTFESEGKAPLLGPDVV